MIHRIHQAKRTAPVASLDFMVRIFGQFDLEMFLPHCQLLFGVLSRFGQLPAEIPKQVLNKIGEASSADQAWLLWNRTMVQKDASFITSCLMEIDAETPHNVQAILFQSAVSTPNAEMLQAVVDRFDALPPDSSMRTFFRELVQSFWSDDMVEPMIELANTVLKAEFREDELAWTAISALIENGSSPAVDGVLVLADKCNPAVREHVLAAIHEMRSRHSLPVLAGVATAEGRVVSSALRIECIRAMGRYPDLFVRQTLKSLTANPDAAVAKAAGDALALSMGL